MNKFYALLVGMSLVGNTATFAQIIEGSNGSKSELAPLTLNKKVAKRIAPKGVKLRTDFTQSPNQYFVLAFDELLSTTQRNAIENVAKDIAYIPDGFYLYAAKNAEKAIAEIRNILGDATPIKSVGALPLAFKIDPALYGAVVEGKSLDAALVNEGVMLTTYQNDDRAALETTLDNWGVSYTLVDANNVRVDEATAHLLAQIAALPYVSYVMHCSTPQPLYTDLDYIMQPNRMHVVNYQRQGPIGRNTYFANWETYGAEYRWDLGSYGRNIANYEDNSYNSHGTDCGLIATGADNIVESSTQGMAPGMQVMAMNSALAPNGVHLGGVQSTLNKGFAPLVSNHSVGWEGLDRDIYNPDAQRVDRLIHQNNNYMCCYPTGNWAYNQKFFLGYKNADYGRITGHIKTNKNGIAVHSTLYPGVDVTWANFGPTFDGRMKPEICAQGSGGTSYASPGVAGLFGVLLEQFKTTYPSEPYRIDVVKAVMLNTALDVRTYANGTEEGFGLDYRTGYGEVNPPAAIETLKDKRLTFDRTVENNGTDEMKITVGANQTELKVLLYWNDPEATEGTNKALVNDLDLEVVSPSGKVFLPWTLDPSVEGVTKAATRTVNRRDNHEQVVITATSKDAPLEAGDYTIRVKGYKVARGPQRFVTTWQTRQRGIVMTSMPNGFRLAPGQQVIITWDMTLPENEEKLAPNFKQGKLTPKVYYRISESASWVQASASTGLQYWSNVDPKQPNGSVFGKNFFMWKVPNGLVSTSELQFRVVADDMEAISGKVQVGERLTERPRILSWSEDKVKLSWSAAKKVTQGKYLIYALRDKYMEVVDSVDLPVTEKEITAPAGTKWNQSEFFAVAVFNNESKATGLRSLPIGFNPLNDEATNAEDTWMPEYSLCTLDQLPLKTNDLEGSVQWYRDNTPVAGERGKARNILINRESVGRYYYTVSNAAGTTFYKSPTTYVTSQPIEMSDSAKWGKGYWEGFVFNKPGSTPQQVPLLTDGLSLYGKFRLRQFSFNSNSDLFPWQGGKPSDISDYEGCPSAANANENIVVMKRRGFAPGRYTLKFERASGIAQIFIRNGSGKLIKQLTTSVNAYTTSVGTFVLNEESSIEIHWMGVHCQFTASYQPTTPNGSSALGRTGITPDFWMNPATMQGNAEGEVSEFSDAVPQAECYSLTTTTPAKLVDNGSNFNPTLKFIGRSRYEGGAKTPYEGNATTDFVVLLPKSAPNERIFSAGVGLYDVAQYTNGENVGNTLSYTIKMDDNSRFSSTRHASTFTHNASSNNVMRILTVRQSATVANLSVNGEKVTGSRTATNAPFSLHKYSIGGTFNEAEPYYFTGELAELVHYNSALTQANERKVRTFLALKHGITLDHDYVMGATTIFPLTSSSKYKYQVAGIGMDNVSKFLQKQSNGRNAQGNPSTLTLALGEWMPTNAGNKANFAQNLTYYVIGANSNTMPSNNIDGVGVTQFYLKRTLPNADAKPDTLSFYTTISPYKHEGQTMYLEMSASEFTDAKIDETNHKLIPFFAYTAADGTQLLRADYAPDTDDSYFRLVWKDGVPNGIGTTLVDGASTAVSYNAAQNAFVVNIQQAQTLDVLDLQGRTLQSALVVSNGAAAVAHPLNPGTYVVRVHRNNASDVNIKVVVNE